MGGPMIAVRGYSDPECLELFSNARRIGERLGDSRKLLPALFGQWVYEYVSGRLPTAMGIARDFLVEAQRTGDPGLRLLGHQSLGITLLANGQPGQALPNLRHAIEGFDPSRHARVAYTYGQNPRVACLAYTG
jgi:predicted ATPase